MAAVAAPEDNENFHYVENDLQRCKIKLEKSHSNILGCYGVIKKSFPGGGAESPFLPPPRPPPSPGKVELRCSDFRTQLPPKISFPAKIFLLIPSLNICRTIVSSVLLLLVYVQNKKMQ